MKKQLLITFLFGLFIINGFAQTITTVSPASAWQGQTLPVTISGNNTHFKQITTTLVWFNQGSTTIIYPTSITSKSSNSITAIFAISGTQALGNYNVNVVDSLNGTLVKTNGFTITTITNPPVLTTCTPASANRGATLTVSISGQNTHFNQGNTTAVWFQQGSTTIIYPTSQTATSATNISAQFTIPSNAVLGNYNVKSNDSIDGILTLTNGFLVTQFTNYTIATSSNPTIGGTTSGAGTYNNTQTCTVKATANPGYIFTNWTENSNVVSIDTNYTFAVTANRTLVANFVVNTTQYTIATSANPSFGGTTSGGGTFTVGQPCTVHASQDVGYYFIDWKENGVTISVDSIYTFTVIANRNLVATFSLAPGIISNSLQGINAYLFPNPAKDMVYIKFGKDAKIQYQLEVKDILGKTLYTDKKVLTTNPYLLDLANFKQGIYFVVIKDNAKEISTMKLLVNP